MAKKQTLPERLQYLQPFRQFLTKIPKSEVGDTTDTSLLEKLLRDQIQGLTQPEAREKLSGDLKELEEYLSDRLTDRLHFVVGFLLIAVEKPEELLKPPVEVKKREERLIMNLPPRSKSRIDEYSLSITWKRQRFYALRYNVKDEFTRKRVLKELNPNPRAISITLENVTGYKHIRFSESPIVWKRVDYELIIPGAYVGITIQASHLFDETEWDPYIATLHYAIPSAVGASSL
ncbi:MAG TPA: hypothetical protein VHC44_07660 [Verrucomicrobiae bacterium]|nr:hypothetical protein [Verrucomicrobiae bacterium]